MNFKRIILIFSFFLFFLPFNSLALSSDYNDLLYEVVGQKVVEGKVNIYFFYGDGCPHCAKEELFLDNISKKYSDDVQIFRYETWNNSSNRALMISAKTLLGKEATHSVPFTVIGSKAYSGYNDYVGEKIEGTLKEYLEVSDSTSVIDDTKENIPFIGEVDVKDVSIFVVAIILGFVDGFNPCAMWILLFLINMLFGMKNKKRMLLLGITFLVVSGLVYFLSMLGLTTVFSFISVPVIRSIIGVVALVAGIYNVRKYLVTRNEEAGCHVVDSSKRKKIFGRIKQFTNEENLFLALFGVIILAVSVNMIELACSTVFPATFSSILSINEITGFLRIFYLLVYTLFYMLDDMIVFIISVCTLSIATTSSKYGKYSSLIGGIIMFLMGILLIFKPEWIMFNF